MASGAKRARLRKSFEKLWAPSRKNIIFPLRLRVLETRECPLGVGGQGKM